MEIDVSANACGDAQCRADDAATCPLGPPERACATRPSDIRITPGWLWAKAVEFAGGVLILRDVCTQPDNPLGAELFWTERDNALECVWGAEYVLNWANWPYSRGQSAKWAAKAIAEARHGAEILALTLADVRTSWYRTLGENADARCHIGRSVGFLEPDGQGGYRQLPGHTMGHAVWYWGPRRRRFERVFGAIGEVIHGLGPQEDE